MMPPKGRKHCRSSAPDVLSNLPDNVIDVILMRLPCKDAVQTSILSRKWRYNWCRLTKLELDKSHWRTKNDILDPTVKFKKIIYQFLTLHEGPITKFTLKITSLERCPKIDNFINFLFRKDIQHLVLHLQVYTEDDFGIVESLELKHFSDVTFNHLREVKIERFTGNTPEMQLIKLLLAKSPLLARMLIDTWILNDEPLDTRLKVFDEVSKFFRASPKAEVVY